MERLDQEEQLKDVGTGTPLIIESEIDLSDSHAHHELEDDKPVDGKPVDYGHFTKAQLVSLIKELAHEGDFRKTESVLKEIKPIFDEIRQKERAEALQRFISNGGEKGDFDYKGDDLDMTFDANFKLLKDRKNQFVRQEEEKRQENLIRKQELLEKIRVLVDSTETQEQFSAFKSLQQEWKTLGPVPVAQAKLLWANYHALVDRFYDNQSIYYELKELDRRKNFEAKLELCVRAEKLMEIKIIRDAIRELNELHHEFKHIGPVPREDKEVIWSRFKAASDAVYLKRDAFLKNLQKELNENLQKKITLCQEVQAFTSFQSDRIKEWNQKTKEVLDLQRRWEEIGGLPREKAREVNKHFWADFKTFFNNKNAFFKKLDSERDQNLKLKQELVAKAKELQESSDWDKTAHVLKELQQQWKEIGPVPEKFRESIFQEFKLACDHFFELKRGQQQQVELGMGENLKVKEEICRQLEQQVADGSANLDAFKELQEKYSSTGFVPKNDMAAIRARYQEAVDKYIHAISDLKDDDRQRLSLESQISEMKNDPMAEQKLFHKEQAIRKKMQKLENDISLWKNNLEFFSRSQNAEKVREEFNAKIKESTEHLHQLKEQLKILRKAVNQ